MRITGFELGLLRAPLRTPFRTALRTVEAVEDVVLRLYTDEGLVGHGSAAPTAAITGETHGSIVAALRGHLLPPLLGRDPRHLQALLQALHVAMPGNTSARAAVDIALHDLWAQAQGQPLYRLLGGGEPRLRTDLTISVDTVDRMLAACDAALAAGFDALKIKLGREPALDLERVRAIHERVAGRAVLRLDANQGWTAKHAIALMQAIERDGIAIDLLEQPVPAQDLDGLAEVTRSIQTPVLADESVFGPREAIELIRRRAADLVNIKLMKTGGIARALLLADIAALHGVGCMIGCMIESSIGIGAAVHVAAARAHAITRVDLDGVALCASDPVQGSVRFDGPSITIGAGAGLGIRALEGLELLQEDALG